MRVKAKIWLWHDGELYKPGDVVQMTDAEARKNVDLGNVEAVRGRKPAADSKAKAKGKPEAGGNDN